MGNNNQPLRKALSVPDAQFFKLNDKGNFDRNKSRSSFKLFKGKSEASLDALSDNEAIEPQNRVPLVETLFLPDFPLRGDLEEQDFEIVDIIAKGAYGNVLKVKREDEKHYYAMKVLDKSQIVVEGAEQQCKDEAAIQSMLGDHPFIVKTYEYWQSHKHLYIVLDYVPYGDMHTLWTFHGFFPEKLVRVYIAEMAMVLDYLHVSGVIYRDIKMENILFDQTCHIQLTDFGLAKWLDRGHKTRTVCGTLQYMAPEVLATYPYGHAADWWSLGVLMYVMLAGKYPADGANNHVQMAQKVFESDFLLPGHVSDKTQDAVNRMLTKSPQRRLSNITMFRSLPLYKTFNFTALIERQMSPKDVVTEDFFPMSGVQFSYSPQVNPVENHVEEDPFSEFDFVWNLPPNTIPVYV